MDRCQVDRGEQLSRLRVPKNQFRRHAADNRNGHGISDRGVHADADVRQLARLTVLVLRGDFVEQEKGRIANGRAAYPAGTSAATICEPRAGGNGVFYRRAHGS